MTPNREHVRLDNPPSGAFLASRRRSDVRRDRLWVGSTTRQGGSF